MGESALGRNDGKTMTIWMGFSEQHNTLIPATWEEHAGVWDSTVL